MLAHTPAREAGDGTSGPHRHTISRAKSMPHSYTQLLYHIVFSTKERRPTLNADIRPRVHQYLGGAIRDEGGTALLVNGIEDHVHILAHLRQDKAISDVLRSIKANSSGWIHRTFPDRELFAGRAV